MKTKKAKAAERVAAETAVADIEMMRHFFTPNRTLSAVSSGNSEKSKCRSVIGKNLRPHDLHTPTVCSNAPASNSRNPYGRQHGRARPLVRFLIHQQRLVGLALLITSVPLGRLS